MFLYSPSHKKQRLITYPIIGRLISWYLFRENKIYYLPQDKVIKIDQSVETPSNTVLPSQITEHFIKAIKDGDIIAEAKIVHKGSKTAIGDVDVMNSNGDLIAKCLATYLIVKK